MSAFLQTPQGDLDIGSGTLKIVTDVPTIASQKLTCLFQFFKGEWFADTRLGVPYFQYILVRNPDLGIVTQVLQKVIRQVPEVKNILSSDISFNTTLRSAVASFTVQVDGGAILQGGPGLPFIVTGVGS